MNDIKKGDTVLLTTQPNGYTASDHPLTVGSTYLVTDLEGSNVWTTCDVPGMTVSYWRGWVDKVKEASE